MKSTKRGIDLLPSWIIGGALILLFMLAFNPDANAAVTGKIAGVVVDAQTGEPLPGANIIVEETDMGAAADPNGYFFILRIPPGTYNVQARMMGYESVTLSGVEVVSDLTSRLKFELRPTVVPGEGVTVKAKADLVKLDLASSAVSVKREDIEAIPFVSEIGDYINRQAGVKNWMVRGGSVDQIGFTTDGLNLVDGRTNAPALMPPLSMTKELNIIKGGFAPEYGNLRSGLINIVTREPSDAYQGSLIFRYSPPHLKHRGVSVYDTTHYWVAAYILKEAPPILIGDTMVDYPDSICWIGIEGLTRKANNAYDSGDTLGGDYYNALKTQYHGFDKGWFKLAKNKIWEIDSIRNPTPDSVARVAARLRESFIWTHRLEGADRLVPDDYNGQPRVGTYGDKPDWSVDVGFGGPVPVVGKFLGDLGFYGAYRRNKEMFALPTSRDYYFEINSMIKFVSHLTQSMKLSFDVMHGEQFTLSASSNGEFGVGEPATYGLNLSRGALGAQIIDPVQGTGYRSGAGGVYLTSGTDVFRSLVVTKHAAYYPSSIAPYNVFHNMQGLTFDHALSENTFYTLRISRLSNKRQCNGYLSFSPRDTVTKYTLPSGIQVTEIPYGYYKDASLFEADAAAMGSHWCAGAVDSSKSTTWNFKVDLNSQVNPYNEIKIGFEYDYADMYTHYEKNRWEAMNEAWVNEWEANPIRGGAYLQDKIEFEGFIATVGLRADWNDPNCEWFDELYDYSYFFTREGKEFLLTEAETHPAEGHFYLSPRVGISHPITENTKLYFNYGDFYSLPASYDMYQIFWGTPKDGVRYLGNPELEWPLTRAYELGTDWSIADLFRVHLAGYYKDIKNQLAGVTYIGSDNRPNYKIPENLQFEDIRGIDFRISKDYGNWVRGWINYDYGVRSYGQIGKGTHYLEPVDDAQMGAWDALEYVLRPKPIFQANIQFLTPDEWGLLLGSFNLSFNYTWEAGEWQTFDPKYADPMDPKRKYLNMQWRPYRNVQARIEKGISFAGINMAVFGEVNNLFDWKYLDVGSASFSDLSDELNYYESLKLPLYKEKGYEEFGEPGNDQFGDFKTDEKSYIDDPNLTHLAFHNPRYFVFGLKVDF